jgi:2-phospho-L-lactate/phosphoenolpyruvate guanylyltransferase
MRNNWAIVPVKGLTDSKTRLSPFVGEKRKLLIEALLSDVLRSVTKSKVYDTVVVISPDQHVSDFARSARVSFLRQSSFGLNRGLDQAIETALSEKAESVTTILADIPLVQPKDFQQIFSIAKSVPRVVMAPSSKGGTNVMLTAPPGVVRSSYGRWSYSKHLRQAQLNQVDAYSISNARVSFDIDTVEDLKELRRRDPEGSTFTARVALDLKRTIAVSRIPS